ncbi:hypothetical protein DKK66_09295 [Aquitalea sp. USM4]|nr:hypothetical protein DKK66_09295 [Aquitalea sp. USM4]
MSERELRQHAGRRGGILQNNLLAAPMGMTRLKMTEEEICIYSKKTKLLLSIMLDIFIRI